MPVLPELEPMVARIAHARQCPADPAQSVADRRAAIHRGMDQRATTVTLPAPPRVTSRDHTVSLADGDRLTVRSYHPGEDTDDDTAPRPGHVYVHGGGWWLGTLDHRDALCAGRAASTGAVVVSVAHRQAPEHRYPVPVEDVHATLAWTAAQAAALGVDPARLTIGGDSSGANLAGLPPALIMTAEFDVLRGDGRAYAERLAAAGVTVTLHEWPGHVHGSHDMTAVVPSARDWQAEVDAFLRTAAAGGA
ncbi:alpha/beta hydrolase [Jiangella alkaliphila]|uniref:Alpha/beta hydrolase fold n=1 Tax=Jiangella alkaliphila TaxID=419479 RepID=A0A1H2LAV0_9ACTN|nr:alpha/beta hydrolase fold domain-containing protein [Jiangella alkaliphila]SDU77711.1 alpha/beta hydrolase fold [Jiangella alkaliphila]